MNCEDCGKLFPSIQGMNLHKARYCYGKVPRLDYDSTLRDAAFFILPQQEARVGNNNEGANENDERIRIGLICGS